MKRFLPFLMLVLALRLDAAHVVLELGDFTADGVTNRKVVWTPPGVSGSGTKVILTDKKLYTVTNSVTISNVVSGVYTVEVQAPPSASRFWLDVPATNGLVNARSILVTSTNSPGAGEVAYSVAASDARFALKTEVSMAEALDAGSVPAVDRLRFPIGNGLYARATVHPNALWLPTNWNGAQVWLAFTGTTNQSATAFGTDTEDPFIYASADGGNSWTLKSAAPLQSKADSQTVAQWSSSGWQADPELYLDTNGVMRVLWMGFHPYVGSFSNVLFTSHSTDGTTWSTPTVLRKWASDAGNAWSTNAAMAGPQIVATPQGLRLYYVDDGNYGTNASGVGTNSLWYVSALDGSGTNWNWASATRCTLSPYLTNNVTPWHFDIALVGSNRWYLQYGSQASSFGEYSTSTNGVNWSAPGMGLFLSTDLKQRPEEYGFYKATWSAVPGANVPTFAAILGHTPLGQTNVEGWNFSLVRSLVPNPLGLVYTGANTNGLLVGGNALYGGVGRLGALTVVDNFHGSSSGKVALGQPFNGWGGIAIGYNSPMAATNYVLASDGLTETRLNARGSGSVNLAVNNTVKATVTSSNASFAVPLYADGVGITNFSRDALAASGVITNGGGLDYVLSGYMSGPSANFGSGTFSSLSAGNITASGTISGDGSGLTDLNITQPLGGGPLTLYTVGDSLTALGGWTGMITNLLGPSWRVVNRAISGRTSDQVSTGLQTEALQAGNGSAITVWVGVNSVNAGVSAASIKADLQSIYTRAKQHGLTTIAITITPYKAAPGWVAGEQLVLEDVNTWILSTATNIDYVLDAYTLMESPTNADYLNSIYDSGDGLHMNTLGYNVMATNIYNAVNWSAPLQNSSAVVSRRLTSSPSRGLIVGNYADSTASNQTKVALTANATGTMGGTNSRSIGVVAVASGAQANHALFAPAGSVLIGALPVNTNFALVDITTTNVGLVRSITMRTPGNTANSSAITWAGDYSTTGLDLARIANSWDAAAVSGLAFSGYSGSLVERMRMTGDGKLGIGVTNPPSPLSISSAAGASNFKFQSWVFSPTYELNLSQITSSGLVEWSWNVTNNSTYYPSVLKFTRGDVSASGTFTASNAITASTFVASAGGLTLPVLTVAPAVSGNNGVLWISNAAAPVLWITTTNGTFAH